MVRDYTSDKNLPLVNKLHSLVETNQIREFTLEDNVKRSVCEVVERSHRVRNQQKQQQGGSGLQTSMSGQQTSASGIQQQTSANGQQQPSSSVSAARKFNKRIIPTYNVSYTPINDTLSLQT